MVQNRTTVDKNKPESADLFVCDKESRELIWEQFVLHPDAFNLATNESSQHFYRTIFWIVQDKYAAN